MPRPSAGPMTTKTKAKTAMVRTSTAAGDQPPKATSNRRKQVVHPKFPGNRIHDEQGDQTECRDRPENQARGAQPLDAPLQ